MSEPIVLDVYLYGKLRRFAEQQRPDNLSLVQVQVQDGDTIADVLRRIGIPLEEIGLNVFYNWKYSKLERVADSGGRLAVFPDDMQLLYKWYFEKEG